MTLRIERPGDVFAPKTGGMAEARERAATAGKLGSRPDGLRWRPMSYDVLIDNRRRNEAPVLLKTQVYDSEVVTEWRTHHQGPNLYHVFEVGRCDETEQTFAVEQVADALSYHAELESAIRERRRVSREIRRRRRDGALLGELLRDYSAAEVVEALGVLPIARDLGV